MESPTKIPMRLDKLRLPSLQPSHRTSLRDGKDRLAQHIPARVYPQTRNARSRKTAVLSLGRHFGDAYRDVAVEIRRREQVTRRSTVRQMGNGGSGDVTAPG